MSTLIVYMTTGSVEQARCLAELAVGSRLAACANIQPGIESVYRWNGAIQTDNETSVIFKTTEACAESLMRLLKSEHSYDCPCLISWKIDSGDGDYLRWVANEVSSGSD